LASCTELDRAASLSSLDLSAAISPGAPAE
jgi:hypothetical protein